MGILYSHIVFQPPDPPHYEDEDGKLCFQYISTAPKFQNYVNEITVEFPLVYFPTIRGNTLVGIFIPHENADQTVLFSHVSV